jgi:hypothetical protein
MKVFKSVFLFVLLYSVSACNPAELTLLNASKKEWFPGIQVSPDVRGGGVNYTIQLIPSKKANITIDSLFVNQCWLPVKDNITSNADTLVVTANYLHSLSAKKPQTPPEEIKGEGILKYTINGKTRFLEVQAFEKQKSLYYQ